MNRVAFYPRLLFFLRHTVEKGNEDKMLVFGDGFSTIALLALLINKFQVYF